MIKEKLWILRTTVLSPRFIVQLFDILEERMTSKAIYLQG